MTSIPRRFKAWFFEGIKKKSLHGKPDKWWKVMCLTGTDYFSSMGFQPSISFAAAGYLAPVATLNLIILTLLGALPTYWLVARESPKGQGSFAIFERLLTGWMGKTLVLVLLGFAFTDFVFTITMCAADATAHIVENPFTPAIFHNRLFTTLILVGSLGLIFLKGFGEAVKISAILVAFYLGVNGVILSVCLLKLMENPACFTEWHKHLFEHHSSYLEMFKTAAFVFPQLALGMSGFETGVAVMPLVAGNHQTEQVNTPDRSEAENEQIEDEDNEEESEHNEDLEGRIKNTRKLLVTVAVIMSIFLLLGSLTTTLLIPAELFAKHGPADGRALAYLAHLYLGETFGTIYDLATILILWFAGASGMAALLSLVPQYLPRYGMAPSWAAARRPLVVFFTLVAAMITVIFEADVDSQAGAFATGLLVMITSAALAITWLNWNKGWKMRVSFSLISLIFIYSCVTVSLDRPDGILISACFILTVLLTSFISRALRSTELRIGEVRLNKRAVRFIDEACRKDLGEIRILAHKPGSTNYKQKEQEARRTHSIQDEEGDFIFLEVTVKDVSDFIDEHLEVNGKETQGFRILRCSSLSAPNAIAALLLHIRDTTGKVPHVYFEWTEGNPLFYVLKYILLGEGETAPLTREILRVAEADKGKRPKVHVG
ncbi:MAG: amino acid transporter [Candidatus Melainabacteria bacterium]|nr:amino acid transporter [Candidatus Melainabacteria bacterium]